MPVVRVPQRSLGGCIVGALLAGALFALPGCGGAADPDAAVFAGLVAKDQPVTGSVTFSGDVPGVWVPSRTAGTVCAAGQITVTLQGQAARDLGILTVASDGSVFLDAEAYGDFHGAGAVFRPSSGFTVEGIDIATLRGKHARVSGSVTC